MPLYITTAKLSEESSVDIATIRDLEERGIIKAAPGREKYRKRWSKTAAYDLRRALRLWPPHNNRPFNAVLSPGALAAAAMPQPTEERVTTNSIEEAMERFQKRTAAITLSNASARAIAEAWIEVRPGSKNEVSALSKVMERVNKGKSRKQAAQSVRAYLVHLGLVERAPGGKRGRRVVPPRPPVKHPRHAYKNGHDVPGSPPPTAGLAGMEIDDFEAVLPILKAAAGLSVAQRDFLIAWLRKRA